MKLVLYSLLFGFAAMLHAAELFINSGNRTQIYNGGTASIVKPFNINKNPVNFQNLSILGVTDSELAKIFSASRKRQCTSFLKETDISFYPYRSETHFKQYFSVIKLGELEFLLVSGRWRRPTRVSYVNLETKLVCGAVNSSLSSVLFLRQTKVLFFSECDNGQCDIYRWDLHKAKLAKILHVNHEIRDLSYSLANERLYMLGRKYKESKDLTSKLLGSLGHPNSKFDIILSSYNMKNRVVKSKLLESEVVNPSIGFTSSWIITSEK